VDKVGSVPYSNHASVAVPYGFTTPLRSALLIVMDVAVSVVAVGRSAGADVVMLTVSPIESPLVWIATTRK
jgi:hypothetical protein